MSELASPASRGVAKSAASTVSQAASGPGGRKGAAPSPEFEWVTFSASKQWHGGAIQQTLQHMS
jgi:hypothetical protein